MELPRWIERAAWQAVYRKWRVQMNGVRSGARSIDTPRKGIEQRFRVDSVSERIKLMSLFLDNNDCRDTKKNDSRFVTSRPNFNFFDLVRKRRGGTAAAVVLVEKRGGM